SSCPTLFVWDGKQYQLVADILGAGVIGHWVAPGERNIPRPTEWVKIDPNVIRDQEGAPSLSRFVRQGGEVELQETKRQISHPVSLTSGETKVRHPSVLSF